MTYAVRKDIENIFGCTNVDTWADLENNGDASYIEERIDWALELATNTLNDHMHEGPYEFPLTATPYPSSVIYYTAMSAGILLYDSRGLRDADPGKDILQTHRNKYTSWINAVLAGKYRISELDRRDGVDPFPEVVT